MGGGELCVEMDFTRIFQASTTCNNINSMFHNAMFTFRGTSKIGSERGEFQLMQILGLLGMHFDAVAVEVEKSLFFFQIGSGHTVC